MLSYSKGQLKSAICAAQQNKLFDGLCAKPLHGKFINWMQSANVNMDKNFQWLRQSLHSESESTLFAIRDQVICTCVYQAKIMGSHVSVMCRLCGKQEETIQHILAGCSVLAPTCYLKRHNLVASFIGICARPLV